MIKSQQSFERKRLKYGKIKYYRRGRMKESKLKVGFLLGGALILSASLLWTSVSFAGIEAILTDDTYTSSSNPTTIFGAKQTLIIRGVPVSYKTVEVKMK
jgi:hypothetical protein